AKVFYFFFPYLNFVDYRLIIFWFDWFDWFGAWFCLLVGSWLNFFFLSNRNVFNRRCFVDRLNWSFHQWLFYYLIYYWGFIDWLLRLFGTWLRNVWRWLYYSLFARLINGGSYFRVRWILTSCFIIFFRFNYLRFRTRLYGRFYRP